MATPTSCRASGRASGLRERLMDLGDPIREIEVVPAEEPTPMPEEAPAEQPEEVPA